MRFEVIITVKMKTAATLWDVLSEVLYVLFRNAVSFYDYPVLAIDEWTNMGHRKNETDQ